MKYISTLIIGFVLLAGCRTPGFTPTGDAHPEYNGIVKVYFEKPDFDYEEIGIISENYEFMANDADVIRRVQKKAAKKGANAIVIVDIRDAPPSYHDSEGLSKMTVMAIKFSRE